MKITRGIMAKPLKVVIYGPEGIGKTTFASQFPEPVFIDTENSTEFLDVARFPKPSSWTMLLIEINEAKAQVGSFKTLVVDTADWAEKLCKEEFIASKGIDGIEDIGFGRGYVYLSEKWGKMLDKLSEVCEAGMNVVICAHSSVKKFEQPDEMGSYDRYELKLEKRNAALLKEWADMILFANYKTVVVKGKEKDAKGKAQGGKRVMFTSHHPCWDAKNRQGLPDELPLSYDQIAHCLPDVSPAVSVVQPAEQKREEQAARNPPRDEPASKNQNPVTHGALGDLTEPDSDLPFSMGATEEPASDPPLEKSDPIPKALSDLMADSDVSENEVRDVIAQKGYYPHDTTWAVMSEEGFVDGWIIPFWKNIVEMIEANPGRLPF